MIVAPSADLKLAERAITFAAVGTAGQRCTSLRRLIVHSSIKDQLVERLKSVYGKIKVGNPLTEGTLVGPLIDGAAFEGMERALGQAKSEGGKVFGGGRVMASLSSSQVGDRNARFVLDYLKTEEIPVKAQDLLDVHPRKIYFFPSNGRVLVKKLVRMHNETLARREKEYAARLTEVPVAGDIELFT